MWQLHMNHTRMLKQYRRLRKRPHLVAPNTCRKTNLDVQPQRCCVQHVGANATSYAQNDSFSAFQERPGFPVIKESSEPQTGGADGSGIHLVPQSPQPVWTSHQLLGETTTALHNTSTPKRYDNAVAMLGKDSSSVASAVFSVKVARATKQPQVSPQQDSHTAPRHEAAKSSRAGVGP